MGFKFENNIFKGDQRKFAIEDSVGAVYFHYMRQHLNKLAQINHYTQQLDTYESLLKKCIRTALYFKKQQISKGDIVVICCGNHLNSCVPMIASYLIGAIPFPCSLYFNSIYNDIKAMNPKIIICDQRSLEALENFVIGAKLQSEIVIFGLDFESKCLQQQDRTVEENFRPVAVDNLFETCCIYYSGGTVSGVPKPVCLNHYSLIGALYESHKIVDLNRKQEFTITNCSWNWITTAWHLLSTCVKGDCRVLSPEFYALLPKNFDANKLWEMVETYEVSTLLISPILVRCLFERETIKYNTSSLKFLLTGGAPLLEEYQARIKKSLPGVSLVNGYGSTEAGGPCGLDFYKRQYQDEPQSVGVPADGYWMRVVDPDTETTLGPNQLGELRLKSKHFLANGYFNRDWSDCFDSDGWFKTGDLVYFDCNHQLFVKDRLKFMITNNGSRVYPVHLESVLLEHPAVKNAAVIGVPTERTDAVERPMGVVVLRDNAGSVNDDDLVRFVNGKVEEKDKLTGGVKIVESLPLTAAGKIMKMKLKQMILCRVYNDM